MGLPLGIRRFVRRYVSLFIIMIGLCSCMAVPIDQLDLDEKAVVGLWIGNYGLNPHLLVLDSSGVLTRYLCSSSTEAINIDMGGWKLRPTNGGLYAQEIEFEIPKVGTMGLQIGEFSWSNDTVISMSTDVAYFYVRSQYSVDQVEHVLDSLKQNWMSVSAGMKEPLPVCWDSLSKRVIFH